MNNEETTYELWQALGGDGTARRTLNAVSRHYYPTPVTRELLRTNRYHLPDIHAIGAKSLERIDRILKETP